MRALATSYRAMQIIHLWSGVPEDLPYGQLALHAFEELGDLEGQALSLNNLAVRAFFEGRWTESLAMFHRAADNFERIGDVARLGSTSYNVADVLIAQGRVAEAEPLLQKALAAARAVGRRRARRPRGPGARQGVVARRAVRGGPGVPRGGPDPVRGARARRQEVVDVDAAVAENLMLQGDLDAAIELAEDTMRPARPRRAPG